jgi:hypothetical protein
MYAFWNNGSPRLLRTTKNVTLPDGATVLEVVGPMPEQDLYRYEETPPSLEPHQAWVGMTYALQDDAIIGQPVVEDRDVEEVRTEKLAALNAERTRRRYPGAIPTPLGWPVDFRHETDEKNILGQSAIAMALKMQGSTQRVSFTGADDVDHELTLDEMILVGLAPGMWINQVHLACRAHKAVIEALETAADVAAYDFTADWPGQP